jgi:hypothetical protein
MPRGGSRPGAGRKRKPVIPITGDVARAVLGRLGELGIPGVSTPADYVLYLLKANDIRIQAETFRDTMNRAYGRPVQAVTVDEKVEVSFERRQNILRLIDHLVAKSPRQLPELPPAARDSQTNGSS